MTDKTPCQDCGDLILPRTASDTGGVCKRCEWKRQPRPEPRELSRREQAIHGEWVGLAHRICTLKPAKVLRLRCPACKSGLRICFTPGLKAKGSLSVGCADVSRCQQIIHLDGLAAEPIWLDSLPPHFETNGNGSFSEIKDTRPKPQFQTGDVVAVRQPSPPEIPSEGEVIEVLWNFTKSWWNYVISSNGTRCLKRFRNEDIEKIANKPSPPYQ